MKGITTLVGCCVVAFVLCNTLIAQQSANAPREATASVVPQLMSYSGTALDAQGRPLSGIAGITFSIYSEQDGGVPLWMETQNVFADRKGNYAAQLGASTANGLPLDLFTSGEARWLGVRVNNEEEQARVLLLSVPYALKAADAQTLAGLPASAFALAGTTSSSNSATSPLANSPASTSGSAPQSAPPAGTVTGSGTTDFIPLWTSTSTIGNSSLFQLGSGATAKLGIGTNKPASTLDVKGAATIRGLFALPAIGVATATAGANSQPQTLAASAFNSTTGTPLAQTFEWQAEPVGNDTATASGSLNLLYGQGTSQPAETGLNISTNGQITFAAGQKFPGTGSGTVTSVGSGAGLAGGPITSAGTLSIANAGVTNAMLQNPSLTLIASSPLTGGGTVSLGGATNLGLKSCSSNQILKYVQGSWTCTNLNSGTVTSVAMSAPSSDFTVSGSPVTTTGTLGLNWTIAPTSLPTANAIVKRDANGSFSAEVVTATNSGSSVPAIQASDGSPTSNFALGAVSGYSMNNSGISGSTGTSGGYGVYGNGSLAGVFGTSDNGGEGVEGFGQNGTGVVGISQTGFGVLGSGGTIGVEGFGTIYGVYAQTSDSAAAVYGIDSGTGTGIGVWGSSSAYYGMYGYGGTVGGYFEGPKYALYTWTDNASAWAGYFNGNIEVTGTVYGGAKDFRIDHPLDPANKYLVHASVESSEMKNIYDGMVTTDGQGEATVQLPDWFEALNTDFRYQLTVIGQFAQAIVSQKIANHQFQIRTSLPQVEVSWQVTGVRQDAFAKAHPLEVEQEKPEKERGRYLHPDVYGAPQEQGVNWMKRPDQTKPIPLPSRRVPTAAGMRSSAAPAQP